MNISRYKKVMGRLSYTLFASLFLLAFTACEDGAVDDLTGKYRAPETVSITSMTDVGVEKVDAKRIFNVSLTGSENITLAFVGSRYFLQASEFTPGSRSAMGNNTYLLEDSYAEVAGTRMAITEGNVNVEKDGDNYHIYGIVWVTDGNALKFDATGTLVYEDDAPTVSDYSYAVATEDSGNGIYSHQITLTDKSGETVALFTVRNAVEATSLAGTYQVVDIMSAFVPAVGQAVPGFDLSAMGLGTGGTCYIENGKSYLITAGTLVITESDGLLSFEMTGIESATSDGETGTQSALSFLNVPKDIDMTFTQIDTPEEAAEGVYSHIVTVLDKSGNAVAGFTLRNGDAADASGEYTIVDAMSAMAPAVGQAVPGTDLSILGLGILGVYYVEGGTPFLASAGKIVVSQSGDVITLSLTDLVSADGTGNAGTKTAMTIQAKKQIQ